MWQPRCDVSFSIKIVTKKKQSVKTAFFVLCADEGTRTPTP
jgi:hypothetical protein